MENLSKLYACRNQYYRVQGVVIAILLAYIYITDNVSNNNLFFLLCVWNTVSYAYVFYYELRYSPNFHPFIILALATLQFLGFNGLSICSTLAEDKQIYFVGNNITDVLVGGVAFVMLQHYLTFAGYDYIYRKRHIVEIPSIVTNVENTPVDYIKWAKKSYIVLWMFRFVNLFINLASISSILNSYVEKGQLITLTLLMFASFANKSSKLSRLFWLVTIIEIVMVLGNGMKEDIITNIIPYCLFLLIGFKGGIISLNSRMIVKLAAIGAFVIYVVFPYVSIFRAISSQRQLEWSQVPVEEVISQYGDYIMKTGDYADSGDFDHNKYSSDYALSRAGSIECNAWLIDFTRQNGSSPKFFGYCLMSLIPRAIWRDKPPVVVGNMMYEMARGHLDWDTRAQENALRGEQVSSLAPGFAGSSYLSFGLIGAIISFIIPGVFIAVLWFYIQDKLSYNIIAIWVFYSIITLLLKDFEAFKDGGIVFYAMSLVYSWLIKEFPNLKYKPVEQ